MKTPKVLTLILSALLFAAPAFAAESTEKTAVAPAAKIDYTDAFLSLALDKAKLYSGKVEDVIGKGVDLAMEESKPTAMEFLRWRAWQHGIKAFVPPIFLALFLGLQIWLWPKYRLDPYMNLLEGTVLHCIGSVAAWVGIVASLIITLTVSFSNIMSFLQLWVAPRIYVIEQVIQLVKR